MFSGQNLEVLIVRACGAYSYHRALNTISHIIPSAYFNYSVILSIIHNYYTCFNYHAQMQSRWPYWHTIEVKIICHFVIRMHESKHETNNHRLLKKDPTPCNQLQIIERRRGGLLWIMTQKEIAVVYLRYYKLTALP